MNMYCSVNEHQNAFSYTTFGFIFLKYNELFLMALILPD